MATPTIKTKGFKKLVKRLRSLPAKIQAKVNEEVAKSALRVQGNARRIMRVDEIVDTGTLRSSIRFEISGDGQVGEIFTTIEYAAFVEFGTVKMGARPYLFPAWNQERPKFIKRISAIVGRSL